MRQRNQLYEELETQDGERKIFRIAKARDKAIKDFKIKPIKDEQDVVWGYSSVT